MKIALIGQQDFGKAALEAFVALGDQVAAVFVRPDAPGAKRKDALHEAALAHGLPVHQFASLRSAEAQAALRDAQVDLGVMAYVLQFAPQEFVNIPRLGTIQYHPSLLPKHRGPSSISWPIVLGEAETGLTIFRPTDGLDEGPVILQKRCAIGPDDTLGTVYFDRLFPMGVQALLEAADLMLAGKHEERTQDESQASYEGWLKDAEAQVHWSLHVDTLYNLVRGCNPAPGAWTTLGGRKLWLYDSRKIVTRTFGSVGGAPGTVAAVTDTALVFNAHGGQLEVTRLKAEGGAKMSAGEWARSVGVKPGDAAG